MKQEFRLPELGENIETGTVTAVMVEVGDIVSVDQPVIELETEKAVVEVPSSVSGTVTEINVKPGQTLNVGDTVFTVESKAEAEKEEPKPVEPREVPQSRAEKAPEGSAFPAAHERDKQQRQPEREQPEPRERREPEPMVATATRAVLAAPSVRRLAREMGVNIEDVKGSGPSGRVSADDILDHAHEKKATEKPKEPRREERPRRERGRDERAAPEEKRVEQPLHNTDAWGAIERQPMNSVRRKTATHIAQAWRDIPHVTQHDVADIAALEAFRKQYAPQIESGGGKLTVTIILVKLLAMILKRFPTFNASVDMANEEIVVKKYIHIGVAVDTPNGLLVPVVRDADKKGIRALAYEIPQLAQKARDRKLALEDMQGGTFTLTNLGSIGGAHFTPIINTPEVAVLGVARARMEPVFGGDGFEPRLMLPLSLSYDHRVIDGADAARFLRSVVSAIEQPLTLWLDEHAEVG